MAWLDTINLIEGLNYYLGLCALVGAGMRVRTYRRVLGLIFAGPNRWPKLLELARSHRAVFLGWPMLLTAGVTFAVMACNVLASRLVFADARATFEDLRGHGLPLAAVLLSGGLMVFVDGRAILGGGQFDRAAVERDLDKAEYWLRSWTAPAVRLVTLGFVHPRRIVGAEVHRLLVEANWAMIGGMWRSALRIGVQFAFGLCLWLTWAVAS